jgi:ABC-type polysaccharide/polyol phosphate export permease
MVDVDSTQWDAEPVLRITDPATVPAEPHPDRAYLHRSRLIPSVRTLWSRREIILTLAQRDIKANYKQAELGIAWAILAPVGLLLVMVVIFKRIKGFHVPGVPYVLYAYSGILPWQFFSSSVGGGANSLLANKGLLAKVHFPRECFTLSDILEAAFNTTLASSVLILLFIINRFTPHIQGLWIPLFLVIEVIFTVGVALGCSVLLVHVRDLAQALPIALQLGMFASPVIWPFSKLPVPFQAVYSFFNPIGPVIDNVRRTMLLGLEPTWGLLAIATAGALAYLVGGYALFKRLEGDIVDIA